MVCVYLHSTPYVWCVLPPPQIEKVVSLLPEGEQCEHFFEQGTQQFLVSLSLHSKPALDSVLVPVCVCVCALEGMTG